VSTDVTDMADLQVLDASVAEVNSGGMVKSLSIGKTKLVAKMSGLQGAAFIAVSQAALAGITIAGPSSPIPLGQSVQLKATGTYTDSTVQDLTNLVDWSAAQPNISISPAGILSTKAAGSAAISASLRGISASSQVSVSPAALISIAVGATQATLPLGGTAQLTALGSYTDGSITDLTSSVSWTSSSPGAVAVSSAGAISTKAVGASVISASLSGISGTVSLSVSPAAIVSIAVNASRQSLALGNSEQLTATGTYTDGSTKDLTSSATWSSSLPGVIAISNTGSVTAKSVGTAVVSVSFSSVTGNITGSANLSASNAALVSIAVSAGNPSLPLGSSEQLIATGSYTDGTTKDLTSSVTWSSSSPGVVATSSTGAVTTMSVGNAVVSASSSTITGTAKLAVSAAALVAINLSSASTTVPIGNTVQLSAIGSFTDQSTKDLSSSVMWASSAPNVLTIKSSGVAAGVAIGTASVAATSGSVSAVVNLSVSAPALSSLSLAQTSPTLPLGGTLQLSVTGTFSDGSTQDVTQQVAWNLDNPAIATISATGLVSGLQIGTSGIEASLNGVQVSDTLTVQPLLTVSYFDATSNVDSTIRVTNPAITGQDLCTMVYVFDQDQQMSECCGCTISQDGLLTLSLNKNLLANPLTGVKSKSGTVLMVAADKASNTGCDPTSATPAGMVIAWATHLPQSASGLMSSSEEPLSNSPLSPTLSSALQAQCSFVQQLGSGQGICSCGSQP
jgi:hypothetical protein